MTPSPTCDRIEEELKSWDWSHTHAYLPYQLIRLWVIGEDLPDILLRELEEE